MPAVRFFLGLLLAAALHAVGTRVAPGFPRAVDLFLVTTVVVARHGRPEGGLFAGLVAGYAADALSGGPFGLNGFADAAVGYGAALAARNLVVARPGSIAALFALGAAAQGALLYLVAALVVAGPARPDLLGLALKVGSSALLGLAWIRLAAAAERRLPGRRSRPSGAIETPKSLLR
jgi:rod shape-determining protein MreD